MLVESWLTRAANSRPEAPALQSQETLLSNRELLTLAGTGAAELAELGVRTGDRVAIALTAGVDFAVALHACMLLGAVAVPLDLRLKSAERAEIAQGALLLERPLHGHDHDPRPYLDASHDLAATAAIIHTSGTSARAKPIELTYGNFLWSALGSAVALGCDREERWLCTLPLSHVGGLSILIRSVIYATTAVIHERFDTQRVLAALQQERITLVSLVATTLARLLDGGLQHPTHLRCALTGGGPVPRELVTRAQMAGVAVSQTYGLTEACSQVSSTPIAALRNGSCGAGPALFCTNVVIAPDGEIMISGPTVSPTALGPDGWLRTGDLGGLDEDGILHVTGRKADTIVSGGENVAPAEVEAVLESHPSVLEAAVVARPDPQWGEAVTAIVVARTHVNTDADELRAHCARHLAPYKVPKRVLLSTDPLPRTASGKLLRRMLATDTHQ
ncbi:MAG: AMP-binding protein [Solirubrobacteraceae bacterium]